MTRKQKSLTILAAGAFVLVLLAMGVRWYLNHKSLSEGGLKPEEFTAVEAEKVRRGSIVRRITAVGTLIAEQKVVIRPEISGKIKRILFLGGQPVKAGDPLIEIEDRFFKAQLKDAEAKLDFAKIDYNRYSKLSEKSAGPGKMHEKSYAELLAAESNYDLAKLKVENTIIRAPFEGVVGLKDVSIGTFVDERTELLTLVDVDPILLDFRLPATYLKVISVGQEVDVTIDGFEGKVFKAIISSMDAKVDPTAHSVAVRATIENKKGFLKPGLFARVKIVVGSKDDTLLLPESSVLSHGDEEFVYRVVEIPHEGVLAPRAVKVFVHSGLSEGGNMEVVRGLKEDDLVITVGQNKVRNGAPVRVVADLEAEHKEDDEEDEESDSPPPAENKTNQPSDASQQASPDLPAASEEAKPETNESSSQAKEEVPSEAADKPEQSQPAPPATDSKTTQPEN